MKSIVIFASGSGSNAEKIISYFRGDKKVKVAALFSDRADCGAMRIASEYNIPAVFFSREELYNGEVLNKLKQINPALIVLAGFLRLLPREIIQCFKGRIINIHPALLPKYGGKGFYGNFVHEAVLKSMDKTTGITIHLVDEEYDMGKILLQKECEVSKEDTPASLAERVRLLEHQYYPRIIKEILKKGSA